MRLTKRERRDLATSRRRPLPAGTAVVPTLAWLHATSGFLGRRPRRGVVTGGDGRIAWVRWDDAENDVPMLQADLVRSEAA
jgi:hypothetical protein